MLLGSHTHVPKLFIGDTKMELANSLKILWVTIDNKLTYFEHISNMLKKVYAKVGLLTRLKHGAILYNEAEVFSLSIRNPKGPPMLQFEWLIHSGLILARSRCLKILQSDRV